MHFGPAIAVVPFNEYWSFQPPKCYLKPKGSDHLGPFLPLLKEMAEGARAVTLHAGGEGSGCVVGKQEVCAEQRVVQEVEVPLALKWRSAISKKRGSQPRWPEKAEGMETQPDTPPIRVSEPHAEFLTHFLQSSDNLLAG